MDRYLSNPGAAISQNTIDDIDVEDKSVPSLAFGLSGTFA
jgi:hypothetical protein